MINFDRDKLDWFIGIVRKYMHIRGDLAQKDLAEEIGVGISTLSRFLNAKTKELDEQLVAKIVAFLDMPLHEIIDFIEEDSTAKFKKLVSFYKEDTVVTRVLPNELHGDPNSEAKTTKVRVGKNQIIYGQGTDSRNKENMTLSEKFNKLSPRQKAYLSDFLDLDSEAQDLVVDIGNQLLSYFKQKRLVF